MTKTNKLIYFFVSIIFFIAFDLYFSALILAYEGSFVYQLGFKMLATDSCTWINLLIYNKKWQSGTHLHCQS